MRNVVSIGFSPCPNDTFMLDALVNDKIDTGKVRFEPVIADVEELNRMAYNAELDVTKLSYFALGKLMDKYQVLNSGSALGKGCGPLLISKEPIEDFESRAKDLKIAIPGANTTANLLFSIAYPHAAQKEEMLFSAIEEAVIEGSVDAGVIIHENRFTYREKGLHKIADLGQYWETNYASLIPLGGIAVKRSFNTGLKTGIDQLLRESVQYAFDHPRSGIEYIRSHAQEMDEKVMYDHIDLYVNDYSLDIGREGKNAVDRLYAEARKLDMLPAYDKDRDIFLVKNTKPVFK